MLLLAACLLQLSDCATSRPALPHDHRRAALLRLSGGIDAAGAVEEAPPAPPAPAAPAEAPAQKVVAASSDDAPTLQEELIGETVGTFLLTLAVVCAGAQPLPKPTGPLAVACILTGLIYAFGTLSGAVFNPAVSLALVLRGKLAKEKALWFAAAQTGGAILAGLAGRFMYGTSIAPAVASKSLMGWAQSSLAEILFTGTIVTVVHHTGVRAQSNNDVVGLAIGLTVFGCAVCSDVSGSCFNPAIGVGLWLAKAMLLDSFSIGCALLYLLGPMGGAALATAAFVAARPREP